MSTILNIEGKEYLVENNSGHGLLVDLNFQREEEKVFCFLDSNPVTADSCAKLRSRYDASAYEMELILKKIQDCAICGGSYIDIPTIQRPELFPTLEERGFTVTSNHNGTTNISW